MGRVTPEIPSASLADIAFMLLIFFLVATTMDVDSGLSRTLPPMPEDEEIDEDQQIRERNIFTVRVDPQDRLLVEGQLEDLRNLRDNAKEFIANPNDDPDLPEKEVEDVEYFGETPISKQVISLQNARGTSYGMYIKVQNELTAAYNELRDELAMDRFGRLYDRLDDDQQAAIRKIYPMRISEAEPRQVGGN
ncbi:MAG: biopolymer transporter ExbD [Bacteroidales bacterium]